jgi:hypothetical protein
VRVREKLVDVGCRTQHDTTESDERGLSADISGTPHDRGITAATATWLAKRIAR